MNHYMNRVALQTFSYFDTGKGAFGEEPERFYHGFVLGLMVEPRMPEYDAVILEFKVQDEGEEKLADTVQAALRQIEERNYQAALTAKGIPGAKIRRYGFAFCGKRVLIG